MRTFALVVPGVVLASVIGLALVRQLVSVETLEPANDVVGNYLQTLGTVYAVLLAFVVFVVWSQFNEAQSTVEAEANTLEDLLRLIGGFQEPARGRLTEDFRQYISAVIVLLLIYGLDDPSTGDWVVTPEPLQQVLAQAASR